MIQKIPADHRHYSEMDWLKTYWLFSFSNYYDPDNIQFGNLRVFNDDWIQEHSGFPYHPHSEMEIVTIVMSGELSHKDTMGNDITIGPGEIQRMSAGTGIRHSEKNDGDDPVTLYQIWFLPNKKGLTPDYGQKRFDLESFRNRLKPVVSNEDHEGALNISANTTIYRSLFDAGEEFEYTIDNGHGVFVYVTEGELDINGSTFSTKDQARISDENKLTIKVNEESQFIFIDVEMID